MKSKAEDPQTGVCYEFPADLPARPILTGHEFGVIPSTWPKPTMPNVNDDDFNCNESYRTILGHFRHEIGHYYWDRFFLDEMSIAAFRNAFADVSGDYG